MVLTTQNVFLLWDLTKRDFKLKYLGSLLGGLWNFLHPLVMILIYTLVFSQVMRAKLGTQGGTFSYSLYLCSGLLAWNFLNETVLRGTNTLLQNAAFLKKLKFPPAVLFGASTLSAGINYLISLVIFLVFLLAIHAPSVAMFASFLLISGLLAIFATGIALTVGSLNVFLRDVEHLTAITMQLWFWFTPIVYSKEALPQFAKDLLWFNPAYAFIESMHDLIFYQRWPALTMVAAMIGWTVASFVIGTFVYKRSLSFAKDQL